MGWVLYSYVALSFVAVPVTLMITRGAWRHRDRPGILSFFCVIAACSLWAISGSLSLVGPTKYAALFWQAPVRMTAVILMPVFFLAFALEYTGRRAWLRPQRVVWLTLIPAVSQILNWTPSLHALFIRRFEIEQIGPFFFRYGVDSGPWFWVHTAYSYAVIAVSLTLLFLQIFRSLPFYRRQAVMIFLGLLLAVVANAVTAASVPRAGAPAPWPDWTQVSFTVSGLVWYWALFRTRFLDVMPVALDAVFASMDDAVIVLDESGRIIDINPAASALLGISRERAVGGVFAEMARDFALMIERSGSLPGRSSSQVAEITVRDRVFELRISALFGQRGGLVGKLAVLRDMTDRVQMMNDLDAYARTVAHDLKNPLAVILGYAELLAMQAQPSEPRWNEHLDKVTGTADTMVAIVNELLLLAKIRSTQDVKTAPLDMARIVKNARNRVGAMVERTGATVSFPESWPAAVGYAAWVEEIWANFLRHVLENGQTPPQAVMGAESIKDAVRFWIRDNGPGLSADAAARLFEESRPDGHRGDRHGLSIVSRIAHKLGGEAGISVEAGAGCTYWFTLPPADGGEIAKG